MNRKEVAVLGLIILLTVVAWIIFDLYHIRSTSTIPDNTVQQIVPLTPKFDHDIINELKNREE